VYVFVSGITLVFGTNPTIVDPPLGYPYPITPSDVFSVVNTNDSGAGSLRQALLDASASSDPAQVISFQVSGVIDVLSPLPTLTHPVVAFVDDDVTIGTPTSDAWDRYSLLTKSGAGTLN